MSDRSDGFRPAMVKTTFHSDAYATANRMQYAVGVLTSVADNLSEEAIAAAPSLYGAATGQIAYGKTLTELSSDVVALFTTLTFSEVREMRGSLSRQKRNAFGVIIQAENPV